MKHRQKTTIILLLVLGAMLILKLFMSLNRQFDPDEMAYLHWAYLLSQGKLPYQDFFFFITPLYPELLSPLFLIPQSPTIAIFGRVAMFLVYLGTLWCLFSFTKIITNRAQTALLAILVFTAFPMTFDKTIEIRPDMVMTLLFLLGTLLLTKKNFLYDLSASDKIRLFLSGLLLSLSFLVMFKIIFVIPAILYLLFTTHPQKRVQTFLLFIAGACVPVLIFFIYLFTTGLTNQFFHAVTYDAMIVNVGNISFPFWKALSPWPLIYVQEAGVSFPWIVNSLIVLSIIPGCILTVKYRKQTDIFLLILFLSAICFICLFPKPYAQYFIIPSVVASIWAARSLSLLPWRHSSWILIGCSLLLLFSFSIQTMDRNTPLGTNQEQLQVLTDVASVIKPDEPVYDMVGSYIFRPDGYFICCHPYIQFAHLLKQPIPTLKDSLIQTKTKFLVMDQKGYVFWIAKPEDLAFMTTHYLPSAYKKIYTLGSQFQCENGACKQLNVHGKPISEDTVSTFDIAIEETYAISVQPDNQPVTINGKQYVDGDTLIFSPSTYRFSAHPLVSSCSIQMIR